ncbi:hypothetical protein CCH79_00019356 [Gambusia affinis]|uniref:Uncharacterized protein n=1 Tax=Gambusia affinis TaxID=33528 RepID=A0A315UX72_GAMAF|nr:hypothetical protein CCH79_00019356 [Gambusia affinis]
MGTRDTLRQESGDEALSLFHRWAEGRWMDGGREAPRMCMDPRRGAGQQPRGRASLLFLLWEASWFSHMIQVSSQFYYTLKISYMDEGMRRSHFLIGGFVIREETVANAIHLQTFVPTETVGPPKWPVPQQDAEIPLRSRRRVLLHVSHLDDQVVIKQQWEGAEEEEDDSEEEEWSEPTCHHGCWIASDTFESSELTVVFTGCAVVYGSFNMLENKSRMNGSIFRKVPAAAFGSRTDPPGHRGPQKDRTRPEPVQVAEPLKGVPFRAVPASDGMRWKNPAI